MLLCYLINNTILGVVVKNISKIILILSSFIGTTSFGMIAIQQASSEMEYSKIHKDKHFLNEARAKGFSRCQQRLEKENPNFIKLLPDDYAISSMVLPLDVFDDMVQHNKDIVLNLRGTCRLMKKKFPLDQEIYNEIASAQRFLGGKQMYRGETVFPFANISDIREAICYTIAIDDQAGCCYLLGQLKQSDTLQDRLKRDSDQKFRCYACHAGWLRRAMRKDRELIFRLLLQEDPFDVKNFYDGKYMLESIIDAVERYGKDNFFDCFPERRRYLDLCKEYGYKTFDEIQEEIKEKELSMFADDLIKQLVEEREKIEQDQKTNSSFYCALF